MLSIKTKGLLLNIIRHSKRIEEMIKAKYQYALDNGLGIMCWAYTQDTYDDFVNSIFDIINLN